MGQSTACKVFGSTNADKVLQCAAVLRKTAFCMFPVSIRKRKLHETMSVFFLLPQITDDMLGFGSVLKGEGAATLHVDTASGQRLGVI